MRTARGLARSLAEAPTALRARRRAAKVERLVICDGMTRSASTWSFNVALRLLREHGARRVHGGYDESVVGFLAHLPRGTKQAVLKCHSLDWLGRRLAASDRARVLYTLRDPADAIASAMNFFSWDFETARGVTARALELYAFHVESGSALILAYEEIVDAPATAVERVAEYLRAEISRDRLEEIVAATSSEAMRAQADRIKTHGREDHDPESLLHAGHIRHGGSYGREVLTADQLRVVDAMATRFGLSS